jgi:hypothetical protein
MIGNKRHSTYFKINIKVGEFTISHGLNLELVTYLTKTEYKTLVRRPF